MLQISAPLSIGFSGHSASSTLPPSPIPGQVGTYAPGETPVSKQNQTNAAVPASGNTSQPDTGAQDNNTETPTRGQYTSQSFTEEEKRQLSELTARDREVRAHEAAHSAAAGRYVTRGAHYSYQRGPDGRNYAVGGEVNIDTRPIPNDPQATLQKAQALQAAALAPAEPSTQDRRVAVSAARMAARARAEILSRKRAEQGYPEGYESPAIRAYRTLSGYFANMGTAPDYSIRVSA